VSVWVELLRKAIDGKAWYISSFRALRRPSTDSTWVVLNEVSLPWR
jgi:hypothetical protein